MPCLEPDVGRVENEKPTKYQKLKDYRIGEKMPQKCGHIATIIAYHYAGDMTVQFEDGRIVEHVNYYSFVNGTQNYNKENKPELENSYRVGEKIVCSNEMIATVIAYRSYHDIDIQFDDGLVVEHISYARFFQGGVPHPDHKPVIWPYKLEKHIGLRKRTLKGYRELLAVHDDRTIDYIDDDGTIVHNGLKYDFLWDGMHFFKSKPRIFKKKQEKQTDGSDPVDNSRAEIKDCFLQTSFIIKDDV